LRSGKHDWAEDCEHCSTCGAERHEQHIWELGMDTCQICNQKRPETESEPEVTPTAEQTENVLTEPSIEPEQEEVEMGTIQKEPVEEQGLEDSFAEPHLQSIAEPSPFTTTEVEETPSSFSSSEKLVSQEYSSDIQETTKEEEDEIFNQKLTGNNPYHHIYKELIETYYGKDLGNQSSLEKSESKESGSTIGDSSFIEVFNQDIRNRLTKALSLSGKEQNEILKEFLALGRPCLEALLDVIQDKSADFYLRRLAIWWGGQFKTESYFNFINNNFIKERSRQSLFLKSGYDLLGKDENELGLRLAAMDVIRGIWKPWIQSNMSGQFSLATLVSEKAALQEKPESSTPIIEWVDIPAGSFTMGDSEGRTDSVDELPHEVRLNAFRISKYPITFEQYDMYCEATGSKRPYDNGWGRGKRPAIFVSWYDANSFAEWMGHRLPTEAEWEYACRASTITDFNTGNSLTPLDANFNPNYPYNHNDGGEFLRKTMPVGSYPPNLWGLHEMHGNVWEWCSDWFDIYPSSTQLNPKGPPSGTEHVFRGGSWYSCEEECRSSYREHDRPNNRYNSVGFRLVSEIKG